MSHFAVLVVTSEFPTDEVLSKTLAPWHEFECTGRDDQYVIEIDKTDDAREQFATSTETRLRDSAGNLHDRFDENSEWKPEFSQEGASGRREELVPDGYERVSIPTSEVMTFAAWASDYYGWPIVLSETELDRSDMHKYGHVLVDGNGDVVRCVDRTNPNAMWDWWVVGGRYGGRLAPGYDPELDPENLETCFLCLGTGKRDDAIGRSHRSQNPEYTCNGCDGKGRSVKFPSQWKNVGNIARWGALDLDDMKSAKVAERRASVEEMRQKAGLSADAFEAGLHAYRAANAVWRDLPEPRPRGHLFTEWLKTQPSGDLAEAYHTVDLWGSIEPAEGQSISDWIDDAPALSAYAVVIDGQWCAKGEMGWFGVSHDEDEDWPTQLQTILAKIPADHYVAVVDCHI